MNRLGKLLLVLGLAGGMVLVGGTVRGATTWYVSPGDNVQAAIGAALSGDTIFFNAGTYALSSQIVIDKPLTLVGDPSGTPLIDFAASVTTAVRITADYVTLDNLHLKSNASSTSGDVYVIDLPFSGWANPLQVYTGFTLSNSIVEGGRRSLWLHGEDMTISGNEFLYDGNRCAIQLRAAQGTTSIVGNSFTGVSGAQRAIILEAGGSLPDAPPSEFWWGDLDISGNTSDSFNQFLLLNMYGQAAGTTLSITGNQIDHGDNSGSTIIFIPAGEGDFDCFDDVLIEGNQVSNTHDGRLFVYLDYRYGGDNEPDLGQIKVLGNALDWSSVWGTEDDTVHPLLPVGFSTGAPTGMTTAVFLVPEPGAAGLLAAAALALGGLATIRRRKKRQAGLPSAM